MVKCYENKKKEKKKKNEEIMNNLLNRKTSCQHDLYIRVEIVKALFSYSINAVVIFAFHRSAFHRTHNF